MKPKIPRTNTQYRRSLNGLWRFNIDRREVGEQKQWFSVGFDDQDWNQFAVPLSWDAYLPELFGYGGLGWYRRSFNLDEGWAGRKIILRFDGANYATTVWINGQQAGCHEGGFDPFEFDISGLVHWGETNTLAVKVDNWPKINRVPNSFAGWWNYGGIYRSVSLLALPLVRIAGVFAHPEKVVDGEPFNVDVDLVNEGNAQMEVTVSGSLSFEGTKTALLSQKVTVPAGKNLRMTFSTNVADPQLWSPVSPNLYTMKLALRSEGKNIDSAAMRIGIRKFSISGTQSLLNNQPVFLSGFDRHEEYQYTGRYDLRDQLASDLKWIQRMGGNMVRMHYQAHPDLYDLADEMGLLVFAEIPFWQVGIKDANEWQNPQVWNTAETMLRTLIGELKNHPSVVIWSVGNECATYMEESRPIVKHLADLARSLDPSRPVAIVGLDTTRDVVFDLVDLPCMNTYSEHNQAGLRERIEKTLANIPGKPLLVTEFGAEAILDLHGDAYLSEEEQASIIEDHWNVFMEYRDRIPGALVWSLADYWHMPMPPDFIWGANRYYFCHGMLTLDRQPKLAVETITRLYQSIQNP